MGNLWKDKKRPIFGLPLSFTTYTLLTDKLLIDKGIIFKVQEEVRLYRIMDVTLKQSIFQRLFNVGTIHCCSADHSTPEFNIKDIKDPYKVKEILSNKIEEERIRKRVAAGEFIGDYQ